MLVVLHFFKQRTRLTRHGSMALLNHVRLGYWCFTEDNETRFFEWSLVKDGRYCSIARSTSGDGCKNAGNESCTIIGLHRVEYVIDSLIAQTDMSREKKARKLSKDAIEKRLIDEFHLDLAEY